VANLVPSRNNLANPTSLLWSLDVPLQGYEGTSGTWSPALDPILTGATQPPSVNNDIIVIRTTRAGQPQLRTTVFANPGDNIVVAKSAAQKLQTNTFVVSDCQSETFFAAAVTDSGTTATLTRSAGGTTAPTNQLTDLVSGVAAGAQVTPLDTVIYYIASSGTPAVEKTQPGPALWRIVSSSPGATPEEVITGVERMEIQYGVDTDSDGVVDEYDDANVVEAGPATWSNVVSVRVAILVRSAQANSPDVDKKKYTLLNTASGPFNDHYERSLYTTTITLRNRTT
jgi:type IV pilus assembly protein PilW